MGVCEVVFACVGCDGSYGEDAVVKGSGVVQVLQHSAKQLQKLPVVWLEGLWVGLNHFAQQ